MRGVCKIALWPRFDKYYSIEKNVSGVDGYYSTQKNVSRVDRRYSTHTSCNGAKVNFDNVSLRFLALRGFYFFNKFRYPGAERGPKIGEGVQKMNPNIFYFFSSRKCFCIRFWKQKLIFGEGIAFLVQKFILLSLGGTKMRSLFQKLIFVSKNEHKNNITLQKNI